MGKQRRYSPLNSAQATAVAQMEVLPTYALVAAMNGMNEVLRRRGQPIRDWDEKDKVIQQFSIIGGKVYALAPKPKLTEVQTYGDGDQKPGG